MMPYYLFSKLATNGLGFVSGPSHHQTYFKTELDKALSNMI